jgi:hypothetical protein
MLDALNSLFDNNPPALDKVSETGLRIVADLVADYANQPAPSTSRVRARQLLGDVGSTKELHLENIGALDSFLDGTQRRVTTRSIFRHLVLRAIASHPRNAPSKRARRPPARFQKKPRVRTPAELEGLRKGNAKRRLEAQARREGKIAIAEV